MTLFTARVIGEPGIAKEAHDRGRILVEGISYLGDLTTEDDDYFISETGLQVAGKEHPFYGEGFCDWFVAEMG